MLYQFLILYIVADILLKYASNFSVIKSYIHKCLAIRFGIFRKSFFFVTGAGTEYVVEYIFGPTVNAARGIAMTVQGAIVQFSSNFVVASKPQIIKLYAEGNIKEMMYLVYQTSNFSYYLLFLFALPLCIELDYVLTLWLGEYPDYTVPFAILIIINSLTWSIKSSRVTALHATGHIKLSNLTVGVILCLTLPVSYIF